MSTRCAAPRAAPDDVDRIVEAWRRERPDLDVAPLQVLSRVSRLARHLDLARGAGLRPARARGLGVRRAVGAAPGRRARTSCRPASWSARPWSPAAR